MLGLFSHDIGIDLGTANTLVMVRGRGIVIDEPSVVAIDKLSKKILAIGSEAKRMVGRTPANIIAVRPLKDGVISDFEVTERMLHYFIRSVHDRFGMGIPRPRVVLGIPSGVTEVEKRAVHDAALNAGARAVFLVEEPMAAAIGAGLPVMEPHGCMIVDIGGGTTEVAVIALGGIVVSTSIRTAGDEMDQEIIAYARQVHNMLIGERMAEEVKIQAGSAFPLEEEESIELRGRDLATGLPKSVDVSTVELRDALSGSIGAIVEAVRSTIEITPPELVADLMYRGIALAGGGALLRGLDRRLAQETKFPVYVAEEPLFSVVQGTGEMLEETAILEKVQASLASRKPPR
ncbi:MAG: rod shape-determining protein [Chloroflexi bacterium]|nr:rod shape-determining protein [Chloroflexota bacterium]MCH8064468.1 rod shape-determining protein [Chloroflexota bacterium]